MHLAYVLGTYPQPSETFIAREMEGLRARGHGISVYSLFAPDTGPLDGVRYGWPTAAARAARRMRGAGAACALGQRWGRQWAADAIDAVVAHFGSQPSTVALEGTGDLPLFLSLHARDLYVEAERLEEKLERAVATVTCTRDNLAYLHAQYPACAGRTHLVYHGLPHAWLEGPVPDRTPPVMPAPLRLLAVGRLVEKKGVMPLLDACALLRQQGAAFVLRVIGEGPQHRRLQDHARRLGIADAVAFDGWAAAREVRFAYQWADVFCCPSISAADGDRDGLPNVLVEAMSTGLPAVGSAFAGIPEAIDDEITGLLVPPGDAAALAAALLRLRDAALRLRLGAAAAHSIRARFAADRWLDELERLLEAGVAAHRLSEAFRC